MQTPPPPRRVLAPPPRYLAQAKASQPASSGRPPEFHPDTASTSLAGPDDPTDPFIVAQATAFNKDPNQIYAFVRDKIAFEGYRGSVRGARGTLWAMAGNTLDKASLLAALLQASGYTTQYQHTSLNGTQAGNTAEVNLLRSMFPPNSVMLGCLPAGTISDDPASNGYVAYEVNDYYWIKYGPSLIDLDPNISNGQPGQTLQAPDSNFTTVPLNLQQQVTVKMNVEQYSQAGALFGFGPSTTTVLSQTFYTWALVGNILSVGNLVQSTALPGLDLTATTYTYTPYILVGSGGADVSQDSIITGTDYQEFYTNFPLGSTILTGVFVEIDADEDWQYVQKAYTHTMLDRIGPAVRQGLSSGTISLPSTPAPALSNFEIATLNILPTRLNLNTFQSQQARVNTAYQNYENIKAAYQALPTNGTPLTAAQQLTAQQAANLTKYLLLAINETITMAYVGAADRLSGQLQTGYYSRVYPSAPRITVANSSLDASGNAVYSLDVLKNDMRVIDGLYQNRSAPFYEEVARGMIESTMEASVLSSVTGVTASDIGTVMATLGDPNQLIALGPSYYTTPNSSTLLASTSLSADAQALILQAVQNGDQVITPNRMVTINGVSTVGWWETDQFGHTVSHFPNGYHQALSEYGATNEFAQAFDKPIAKFIGQVEGVGLTCYAFAGAVLESVASNSSFSALLKNAKDAVGAVDTGQATDPLKQFFKDFNNALDKIDKDLPKPDELGTGLIDDFAEGLEKGIENAKKFLEMNVPFDPEVPTFLTTPLGPPPIGVTPGATPGVTVTITTDPNFTIPFNGNELPVYDVNVVNTGPTTDYFQLSARDNSGNFITGIDDVYYLNGFGITLKPGQAGQVNLCSIPASATGTPMPAIGTTLPLAVTATGTTGGATANATTNYVVPAIPSLSLNVDPPVLTVTPGGTVAANLILTALGNAATGSVTLSTAADAGISISGVTSPVTVPQNSAISVPVTFTAAANAAFNIYRVVVTATYSALGGTQSTSFSVPVTVQSVGACAQKTALTALQTGATSLGNMLSTLATDMNMAASSPSNSALVSRIGGDVSVVTSALGFINYLQSFTGAVTTAGNAVAAATPANLLGALNGLDASICPINDVINQAGSFNTTIYLNPNSLVTGPNLSAVFTLRMFNNSASVKVYHLSVTGVPAGVATQFNQSSVTLGPAGSPTYDSYNSIGPITLTLTPGASFTAPFTFNLVATPVGAPEFAISAPGSLLVRPQQISVDDVTVSPAYGPAGTKFTITARVFAEVNQDTQGYLVAQPYNSAGSAVTFGASSPLFSLTTTSALQTVTIGTIDSTNLANGSYTVAVSTYLNNSPAPGATAAGAFLVGAPLSGTLTANANSNPPGTVPPGSSAVNVALNLTRDAIPNPISTLVGTVPMQGVPRNMALYNSGNKQYAYVCSDSVVNIVDTTDPTKMQVVGTFAGNILTTENGSNVTGFQVMSCSIYNSDLLISYSRFDGNTTANPIPTHFATFSLTNPISPVQVGSVVDISRSDSAGLYVAGSTALMFQSTTFYNPYDSFINGFTGDIWAADLSNAPTNGTVSYLNDIYSCGGINATTNACNNSTPVPTASYAGGACTATGTTPVPNDPTRGGPFRIGLGTSVNGTTSYFTSSNGYSNNVLNPSCPAVTGQLLVVDTTTPASPALVTSVTDTNMAFMSGIAIQGNLAVAVGDSLGIYDINTGYYGTLVISAYNISNPRSPTLISSITTQLADKAGSFIVALGANTFAVGNTTLGGKPELVLVDASNPQALRYIPYDAAFVANPTTAQNGFFFALSSTPASSTNSLSAFQLSTVNGPQLTVKLQLPKGNGVAVESNSFSLAPSSITAGTSFDTYEWDQPTPNTITFKMDVSGVNPGDVPTVVSGGELDFTAPSLGSAKFVLPPLTVLSQQILSISPETQGVQNAGSAATYVVSITNPTNSSQTFVPSTLGIPASWGVQEPASVTVAAGATQTYNLTLTPALSASVANYNFFAVVNTPGGITASVGAVLTVYSIPNSTSGNVNTGFTTYTSALNPGTITVGQSDSATFQLLVTNTGNTAAYIDPVSYSPSFQNATYNGWGLSFNPGQILVQPGLNNTALYVGTLTIAPSYYPRVPVGFYPVTVQTTFNGQYQNVTLTVNVVAPGVTGSIQPGLGTPQTNFSLNLLNTGPASDTYTLTAIGTFAQSIALPSNSGAIASGATGQIPFTLEPGTFLNPGNYTLQIRAVSQANPAAQAVFSTTVTVPSSKGVTTAITPTSPSVQNTPGSLALLFQTTNTGNVPDNYTASILGTTGPVTANLNGGQSVALFPVLALGNSELPLNATVTGPGKATITVGVTSLSDNTIKSQATVTINNSTAGPPTAVALPTQANTPAHRLALLDATGSSDANNLPLTYLWTLTSAPAGSALNSSSIAFATSALAAFRPDVLGSYQFNVAVSNGTASANAMASYTAVDAAPIAVPGRPYNTGTGGVAFLTAKNSYDPDGQPITFAWTLVSAPNGSAVTSAAINSSQTPNAFFTPDVAGAYQFQLVVSDAGASSTPATLTVTAYSGTIPPNADAGRDQNAALHATVTLNGSASSDPNPSPAALNYQWTISTAPAGSTATLSAANTASPQFTPNVAGDYQIGLVVSNAHGASPSASTTVHVYASDVPPNASAGNSQYLTPGATVTLSAQGSSDPDNGPLNLAYLWWLNALPSGSTASLQGANTATTTFVADKSGYYIGRVEATDGLLSGFANTLVTSAAKCDADANGVINQTDITLIQAALGQTAGANDPRDFDGSGTITSADVTGCTNLINQNAPVLQISPGSITQTLLQGGAAGTQTLALSSTGNAISFNIASNQSWLTTNIASGSTASVSSVVATINPTGLTPATYQGMLTFTPSAGLVQTVGVTLTITPTGPITASPALMNFTVTQGGSVPPLQANVSSTAGAVAFTVTSDASWLTTAINGGSTPALFNVTATPGNLAPGNYTGHLNFASGSNPSSITVTMTVNAPVSGLSVTLQRNGTLAEGESNATYTATVSNSAASGATSGTVTFTENTPSGVTLVSLAGNNWTCSANTCTRSDALQPGHSYDPITITVNVAANATVVVNTVSAAGGGSATATASDTAAVTLTGPNLCDINTDSLVNLADVQKAINEALGTMASANDQNADHVVNVVDIQIEINAVLNLGCAAHQ